MRKFNVTGMSCAACSARVEKAVSNVEGVTSCSVSLLTNSMGVEGSASDESIIKAVIDAGYGASSVKNQKSSKNTDKSSDISKELSSLRKRLWWSVFFVLVLMYFSMGHSMLGLPVPSFFVHNHIAIALVQMILAFIVMVINQRFFINGFKGMIHGSPNMDSLVALGSGISFLWSTFILFQMTDSSIINNSEKSMDLMMQLYFESAAMILALITVGKTLEAKSKGKTTNALKAFMELSPKTAIILKNNEEIEVPVEDVKKDDIFIVRPGMSIPVDGIVLEGDSAVNESSLTGESIPVDKAAGSKVSAGTVNQSGFLKCKATYVGEETTLSKIIQMVSDASATKAPIAKIADKVSGIFVPVVISIAVVTTIVWLCLGQNIGFALARGISVLVISCPCALGLATPVAIMVGNGVGAKNGILFKTAQSLELTGKTEIVVLDKTGTITKGKPVVSGIFPQSDYDEEKLLKLALNLEKKSEHPLSKAIVESGEEKGLSADEVENFEAVSGRGIKAVSKAGEILLGGNYDFISSQVKISEEDKEKYSQMAVQGLSPIYFSCNNKFAGVIVVSDEIKEDSAEAICELNKMGIETIMLTGDNQKTAEAIAKKAGIERVIAQVLPDEKESKIRELKKTNKIVTMVGDGINDAPALTAAHVGIAIGSGTDVAIDAAEIVVMDNSLMDVVNAIKLSRKTLKNIKENLFWAFIYNIIGIPLAAGVYIKLFGWELNPMFGAAAMSLSSVCVVTNALRLNFVKLKSKKNLKENKNNKKIEIIKEKKMTKTIKIEGMMCSHCEAHVKSALEALGGVSTATASHEKGTAIVELASDVSSEDLTKAVEGAGYKVLGVE